MDLTGISDLLGQEASSLLEHTCDTIPRADLALPGPDYIDRVLVQSDRKPMVLGNLQRMLNTGRLAGSGYVSILPVDQGIEHSAGASFAPNPRMFDPDGILELAVEGGCNAVASTFGVLGMVARKYAHKMPFIVKLNHNAAMSVSIASSLYLCTCTLSCAIVSTADSADSESTSIATSARKPLFRSFQ